MSFQSAIPWQVALRQSLPPLHRPETILHNQRCRTIIFRRVCSVTFLNEATRLGILIVARHPAVKVADPMFNAVVHIKGLGALVFFALALQFSDAGVIVLLELVGVARISPMWRVASWSEIKLE